MNFRRQSNTETPEINLIPLIDILLVVLIFLLISTSFTRISALRVQLPQSQQTPKENLPSIQIDLSANGKVAINQKTIGQPDIPHLAQALLAESKGNSQNTMVIIHADAQASHQSVIRVLEAARNAGLTRVSFATKSIGP